MKKASIIFILLITFSQLSLSSESERKQNISAEMIFKIETLGGNCNDCTWVSAQGVIAPDTPKVFREFYSKEVYPRKYNILINSTGGNLLAGMELGEIFREKNLRVIVAETYHTETDSKIWPIISGAKNGVCISACTFALMGGGAREIHGDSIIGFHQYFDPSSENYSPERIIINNQSLSLEQIVSAQISSYLSRMGISQDVMLISSTKGPNEYIALNRESLQQLNILTGQGMAPFTVQLMGNGIIAISENLDESRPFKTFKTYCIDPNIRIFEITINNARDISGFIFNLGEFSINLQKPGGFDHNEYDEIATFMNEEHRSWLLRIPSTIDINNFANKKLEITLPQGTNSTRYSNNESVILDDISIKAIRSSWIQCIE